MISLKKISVVIPTYNRPDTLSMVLDSYYAQKGLSSIIIIDDCSELSYDEVINTYKEKYPKIEMIYLRNKKNIGAGASRNIGLAQVRTEYVLWGEDDAFLAQNYAEKLMKREDGKTVLFGSIYYGITPNETAENKRKLILQQQKSEIPVFNYNTLEGYYRKNISRAIEVPWGHALILAPMSAYSDVKYFEGYKVNGYREETDAQVQMIAKGYRILYCSDAECYHFPAINMNGGQHSSFWLRSDIYKLKNNGIFLKRNLEILKKKYPLKGTFFQYQMRFMAFLIQGYMKGVKRRLQKIWIKR